MNRSLLCLALVTSAVLSAQVPVKNRHVVVISIDGFPAYALNNNDLPLPNIRRLIEAGATADAMTPVNPTVTWPNHTTLVTGVRPSKHSVIYNGGAVRGGEGHPVKVEPHVPKEQLVAGFTLYDVARKAGLTTAEVDWVAVEKAENINWSFAELPSPEGVVEREMVQAKLISTEELNLFARKPITLRDELWTRAAEHILINHKPNLLLFHLLTTDSAQHQYGARSLAGNAALVLADARVGRLVEAARRAGIHDQTTFFIVSDHGFKTFTRIIRPNALLKANGLDKQAWVVPEGGTAMVYATVTANKDALLTKLRTAFLNTDGVSRVLEPRDFDAAGLPNPRDNNRMSDLVLVAADGYAFQGAADGDVVVAVPAGSTPGAHGYLNTDPDMNAIFVASGRGVKPGIKLGQIQNLDVAPTIGRLLGVTLTAAEGHSLDSILQ